MKKRRKSILKKLVLIVIMLVIVGMIVQIKFKPQEAILANGWNLILVNKNHFIPEDYEVDLMVLPNGKSVDSKIYEPLQEMVSVAESEGLYMVVVEAYRTEAEQQEMLDEKIEMYIQRGYPKFLAEIYAQKWVAKPGTSEHQLGIAVDINPDYTKSDRSQVYAWLEENGYKYGFIYRYPEDKVQITGINNEPWHYRYVGVEAAKEMYEKDLCLEEYLK